MERRENFLTGRFYLEINGQSKAVFTELSGLQVETEVFEYREGGRNDHVHQLPGPSRVGNITLKCGMAADGGEFFKWYMDVVAGKIKPQNVSIVVYNASGTVMARWHFPSAYPVRWVGPILSADSSGAAIETLELAHDGFQPEPPS
jgi:phage tail-like protein